MKKFSQIKEQYRGQTKHLDATLSKGRNLEDENKHDEAKVHFDKGYKIHAEMLKSKYHENRAREVARKHGFHSWNT